MLGKPRLGTACNNLPAGLSFDLAPCACDLNKDGFQDVIVGEDSTSYTGGGPLLFWGRGSGIFVDSDASPIDGNPLRSTRTGFAKAGGWLGEYQHVACGDIDNNGHADVLVANSEGDVHIFMNNGIDEDTGLLRLAFDPARSSFQGHVSQTTPGRTRVLQPVPDILGPCPRQTLVAF